jgi:hypothetical protein
MGISADPVYSCNTIPLDSAGSLTWQGFMGLIHLVGFVNEADGSENLTGIVTAQLGFNTNADPLPMRTNSKIASAQPISNVVISWAAQPGIAMKLFITHDPRTLHVDTPPERQLVSSSVGTTLTTSQVTVNTGAGQQLAAASATRQSVTVRSLLTNTDRVYIGASSVTSGNGLPLEPGESVTIDHTSAAIYATALANGQALAVMTEQ